MHLDTVRKMSERDDGDKKNENVLKTNFVKFASFIRHVFIALTSIWMECFQRDDF